MKKRPTKCIIHFNRQREKLGMPWTVHNKGKCHPAAHVIIETKMESEEKPHLRSNPRYFFTCKGFVHHEGIVKKPVIRIKDHP